MNTTDRLQVVLGLIVSAEMVPAQSKRCLEQAKEYLIAALGDDPDGIPGSKTRGYLNDDNAAMEAGLRAVLSELKHNVKLVYDERANYPHARKSTERLCDWIAASCVETAAQPCVARTVELSRREAGDIRDLLVNIVRNEDTAYNQHCEDAARVLERKLDGE